MSHDQSPLSSRKQGRGARIGIVVCLLTAGIGALYTLGFGGLRRADAALPDARMHTSIQPGVLAAFTLYVPIALRDADANVPESATRTTTLIGTSNDVSTSAPTSTSTEALNGTPTSTLTATVTQRASSEAATAASTARASVQASRTRVATNSMTPEGWTATPSSSTSSPTSTTSATRTSTRTVSTPTATPSATRTPTRTATQRVVNTPTRTPSVIPGSTKNGFWSDRYDPDDYVSFSVISSAPQQVASFWISMDTPACRRYATFPLASIDSNGQFSYSYQLNNGNATVTIHGTFTSATTAVGTADLQGDDGSCGGPVHADWHAHWVMLYSPTSEGT